VAWEPEPPGIPKRIGRYAAQMALTELAPMRIAIPVIGSHLITTGNKIA
jgi:hypothetical protein